MGDDLSGFTVVNLPDADLSHHHSAVLEASTAETIHMISVQGIDPNSLINEDGELTAQALQIQAVGGLEVPVDDITSLADSLPTAASVAVAEDPIPEIHAAATEVAIENVTKEVKQELNSTVSAIQLGLGNEIQAEPLITALPQALEAQQHQLVTIDGKQLFILTADGTLAAVTADILQKGAITLSDAVSVAPSPADADADTEVEPPASKKMKSEHLISEDPPTGVPAVASIASTAALDLQHTSSLIYLTAEDHIALADDSHKAHRAVPPKAVSTPRPPPPPRKNNSDDISQAWFTTKDDKQSMQVKGHQWKQGQWSKDEVEVLQSNITQYCKEHLINDPTEVIFEMSKDERKDFYRTVARGLNRPLFSVYRRVIRMYDQKNHIGKYSPEEITQLKELRARHGNDWAKIGAALGRSASSVKDKCRLMRDSTNSGKWLPEEEHRLAEAVYTLSGVKPGENVTSGLSWANVSERVVTRSEKQCRTKWLNYLNWKQQGGTEWTRLDDIMLVEKIHATGASDETQVDWNEIADNWSSVRSPQWLRGKWWTMKRHVTDYNILSFQDLIKSVRDMHNQNYRSTSVPQTIVTKSRGKSGHLDGSIQIVPVINSDSSNVIAAGDEESTLISYEVLQGLQASSQQQHQGALLITQPQNNPANPLPNTNFNSDHIIVHSLPVVTGADGVVQLNAESQLVIDSTTGMIDPGETSKADLSVPLVNTPITITSSVDDIEMEASLAGSSVICGGDVTGEEVINTLTAQPFIQSPVDGDVVSESSADGGSSLTTADMVLVSTDSPHNYVRSSSHDAELIHMSSLSDPMLPSDGADLICCSDIEGEKTSDPAS